MNNQIWSIIFADTRTLDEAFRLDDEFRTIEQQSFMNTKGAVLSEKVRQLVSYKTYQKVKDLEEKHLLATDPEQLRLFFELVHKKISQIPRLQIQVAVTLNDQMLDTIWSWVKSNIPQTVFLDIVVKPHLLAGCVIVYEGIYKDYSLRTALHDNAAGIFKPIMQTIAARSSATGALIQVGVADSNRK